MSFLPVNKKDMNELGWEQLDILFVSGDAYVDHPSFGHAIITRLLESKGYRVGIIPQPNIKNKNDFLAMGIPRLAVLISSGVIDSMVNNYTASKKPRSNDSYSPGGKSGYRPDRALIKYSKAIRTYMGDVPIIIGGVEASLRRFAHYDYWSESVMSSILEDTEADLVVYGNGERSIVKIIEMLDRNIPVRKINGIEGTSYFSELSDLPNKLKDCIMNKTKAKDVEILPSFEEVKKSNFKYATAFKHQYQNQDPFYGKILMQKQSEKYAVQNPPQMPLSQEEMDQIYALKYERSYHPMYEKDGGIPAIEEVEFSITSNRGCFGNCSFCSITFHQGRIVQSRSKASIIDEAKLFTNSPRFKGYIHDVGGPTANFRYPACDKQLKYGVCKDKNCLFPEPCKSLKVDHNEYLDILRDLRKLPRVKKVFIRSGIRFDYLIYDKDNTFLKEMCKHHVSGQLKVAPEHVSDNVLNMMGKPKISVYDKFVEKYSGYNRSMNLKQFLVPYFISGHPGSTLKDAIELALYIKKSGHIPEQVQQFYPTPGTVSTCMYYTEIDPRTMKNIYVPKDNEEKAMQRALMQFSRPENHAIVLKALIKADRKDLIGFNKNCLIKPRVLKKVSPDINNGHGKSKIDKKSGSSKTRGGKRKGRI